MSDLEAHVVLSSISPIPKQRTNKSSQRETFIWTVGGLPEARIYKVR